MECALIFVLSLFTLFFGCSKQGTNDAGAVAEEIQVRPIVAVVPLLDSSKNDLPWNLSDELTDLLFKRLAKRDKFYLVSLLKVQSQIKKMNAQMDPFSLDLSWMKRLFDSTEFVVFTELIEHDERPLSPTALPVSDTSLQKSSADMNITLRLRVFDVRGAEPKIVLQELLHETHRIPRQFTRQNFFQVSWKDENFNISPLGMAHDDLIKTLAGRLEEYLLRAKRASRT